MCLRMSLFRRQHISVKYQHSQVPVPVLEVDIMFLLETAKVEVWGRVCQ